MDQPIALPPSQGHLQQLAFQLELGSQLAALALELYGGDSARRETNGGRLREQDQLAVGQDQLPVLAQATPRHNRLVGPEVEEAQLQAFLHAQLAVFGLLVAQGLVLPVV